MSITSDIRTYADSAVSQGKQVIDQSITTAQSHVGDVTEQAGDLVAKARESVADIAEKAGDAARDLRSSAEKAVNLDAITSAVEPYVAQAKEYTSLVTDKVEGLVSGVRNDKRVALVVDTLQDRVVKPVQSITGLGGRPVRPAAKPASKPAAKPSPKPTAKRAKPTVKSTSGSTTKTAPARKTSGRTTTARTTTTRTTTAKATPAASTTTSTTAAHS